MPNWQKSMRPDIKSRFQTYHDLLLKWQKSVNLIAPSTLNNAWDRHFEDSLQIVQYVPKEAKNVADIGSGAGFPGLVLAITRPDLKVQLIDSDSKKATFLSVVSRETNTTNVTVHTVRVETILPTLMVDVVTARALASLTELLDLTESQWGRSQAPADLVFLKGADSQKEIDLARKDYVFDVQAHMSQTSDNARILCISGVSKTPVA